MKMMNDYFDIKSSEESAEELFKNEKEEILNVTLNGTLDAKERRKKREIANSNERRRMQSINAGFQSLRTLLPYNKGDKMSKATILQQTADYIYNLEQEKSKLILQCCQLKQLLNLDEINEIIPISSKRLKTGHDLPLVIHTNVESSSSDDGLGPMSPGSPPINLITRTVSRGRCSSLHCVQTNKTDLVQDLQTKLQQERLLRFQLEEQLRSMEPNLCYQQFHGVHHVEEVILSSANSSKGKVIEIVPKQIQNNESIYKSRSVSPVNFKTILPTSSAVIKMQSETVVNNGNCNIVESILESEPKIAVKELGISSSPEMDLTTIVTANSDNNQSTPTITTHTSRQNLETIVEAIRHLEGDMFTNDLLPGKYHDIHKIDDNIDSENRFLNTEHSSVVQPITKHSILHHKSIPHIQQQQQQRPGVIVIQHS